MSTYPGVKMIKLRRFLSVSIVVAVCLGLMLVPAVPSAVANPGNDWGFEIQPSALKVVFNETFTVNATVTWFGGGIACASMHLDFDPTLLECTGITIPSTLPNPPDNSTPDRPPFMPKINNTAGYVEDGYSLPYTASYYIYEDFVFATIEFKSKSKEGICNLTFNKTAGVKTYVCDKWGDDYLNWTRVVNGTVEVVPSATLEGNVTFTGRGGPGLKWIESFNVSLYAAGGTPSPTNALWTGSVITNTTGFFTISNITSDTYDIGIKNWTSLSVLKTSVTLTGGVPTQVDFGEIKQGDCKNDDDEVTLQDRILMYSLWGGSDFRGDLKRDGDVGLKDRILMYNYWGEEGGLGFPI